MAKPAAAPPPWGTAGVYPPSTYQDPLPWGDANPLGGGATPWSGASRLNAAGLVAFATQGFTPELPTEAEPYNEWLRQMQETAQWVQDGRSVDDAAAFIVETTALGKVCVQAVELTLGAFGALGGPVDLPNGANLPDGKDLNLAGTASVLGSATSVVDVGLVDALDVEANSVTYDDMGIILDIGEGATRWNKTSWMLGDGAHSRAISVPDRGMDVTFTTINAIVDTTADAIRENLDEDEPVWITITARFECDTATTQLNTRLKIFGPATIDVDIDDYRIEVANVGYTYSRAFLWVPTDDFVLPGTIAYQFRARFGVSAGTLLMTNISIKCEGALRAP